MTDERAQLLGRSASILARMRAVANRVGGTQFDPVLAGERVGPGTRHPAPGRTARLAQTADDRGRAPRDRWPIGFHAIGSIAAVLEALLVIASGWELADAIASLAVVILVVPRALLLLREPHRTRR